MVENYGITRNQKKNSRRIRIWKKTRHVKNTDLYQYLGTLTALWAALSYKTYSNIRKQIYKLKLAVSIFFYYFYKIYKTKLLL